MIDLIARIEAATAGSRELDVEIYLSVTPIPEGAEIQTMRPGTIGWSVPRDQMLRSPPHDVPRYTTSLDAATSLVPEGWVWDIASTGAFWLMPDGGDLDRHIVVGGISDPALAICVGALQARLP